MHLDRAQEAVAAFKKAIEFKPDSAEAHFNLGLGYLYLKDKEQALKEYEILKPLDSALAEKLFNVIPK